MRLLQVRGLSSFSRRRGALVIGIMFAAGVPALAQVSGAAAGGGGNCGTGWGSPVNLTQFLALPGTAAGITAGRYSEAQAIAFFNAIDKNGDALVCAKGLPVGNGNGAIRLQFGDNVVDDTSSS